MTSFSPSKKSPEDRHPFVDQLERLWRNKTAVAGMIVIAIFGAGRIGRIGAELGRGIRDFREALSEDEGQKEVEELSAEQQPITE